MEILKVGETLELDGYSAIVLTDNENANISAFANANQISESEAARLLGTVSGLQDFYANLIAEDAQDIVITDDVLENDMLTNNDFMMVAAPDILKTEGAILEVVKTSPNSKISSSMSENTLTITANDCIISIQDILKKYAGKLNIVINGSNVSFSSIDGISQITNNANDSQIFGSDQDDNIINNAMNVFIDGGSGNNNITNAGMNVNIFGGSGNDTITNNGMNVFINGNSGEDTITNNGMNADISGGSGNDTIINNGMNFTHVKSSGNDTVIDNTQSIPSTEKEEAIERVRNLYSAKNNSVKNESERLGKFMENNTILKLNAVGVSAAEMEELLNGLFPTLSASYDLTMYTSGYMVNMPTCGVDAEKLIKQLYACYGEDSPLLGDNAKAIGRVLNMYADKGDGKTENDRFEKFTANDTVNKLKAQGVPDTTIESMKQSLFPSQYIQIMPTGKEKMTVEEFFKMINTNDDNEITADEVIKAFNTTTDKNLKALLSYFTDGKDVTAAFKLGSAGVSIILTKHGIKASP